MISQPFDFHAPRHVDEALLLLDEAGERARVLAGGMTLIPLMNLGLVQPEVVVSLNHIDELDYIVERNGELRIGAQTRHATVQSDAAIARAAGHLAAAAAHIGDVQVRNRGTLGGSLAHADPAANYLPVLLASDATVVLQSKSNQRVVAIRDFVVDLLRTSLTSGELVVEVRIPSLRAGAGAAYAQMARVEGSFPMVTASAVASRETRKARVAIGGVTARPVLVECGLEPAGDASHIAQAEVREPLVDMHGDAAYRRSLAGVFAERVLTAAVNRAGDVRTSR